MHLLVEIYIVCITEQTRTIMKLIQANPKRGNKQTILSALNEKERSLRGKATSFSKSKYKWKHINLRVG